MKKLLTMLLILTLLALPAGAVAETVVTSFFPIYVFALNLTDGIEGLTVRSLTSPDTGCLHDYQLQPRDMKVLSQADLFLINGAGMEGYLEEVMSTFPDKTVVDASHGILEECEEEGHDHGAEPDHEETPDHDHDEASGHEAEPDHDHDAEPDDEGDHGHDHDHGVNAHIWLDPQNAILMVGNLAQGLMDRFPEHAAQISANRDDYIARLTKLDAELEARLTVLPRKDIITFHEAFPYLADAYGLHVAAVLNHEPEDALTPGTLAQLCRKVEVLGLPPLFVEPQYEDAAARVIARETGAAVYELDPIVTGPSGEIPLTYYEDVMRRNADALEKALGE